MMGDNSDSGSSGQETIRSSAASPGGFDPNDPKDGNGLPQVKKAVNSNLPHASQRAVERGIFPNQQAANQGLRQLSQNISKNGFPRGAIRDPAHVDRILVPVGNRGMAAFQVGKNGTAKLKTVLNAL